MLDHHSPACEVQASVASLTVISLHPTTRTPAPEWQEKSRGGDLLDLIHSPCAGCSGSWSGCGLLFPCTQVSTPSDSSRQGHTVASVVCLAFELRSAYFIKAQNQVWATRELLRGYRMTPCYLAFAQTYFGQPFSRSKAQSKSASSGGWEFGGKRRYHLSAVMPAARIRAAERTKPPPGKAMASNLVLSGSPS